MAPPKTPPQPPPNFSGTPEFIVQKMKAIIEKYNRGISEIQDMVTHTEPEAATFKNLVASKMYLENDLYYEGYLRYLQYISPGAAIRDAARESERMMEFDRAELRDVFYHVKAICNADEELDKESKRVLRIMMGQAHGKKNEHGNERISEIDNRLRLLQIEFEGNLGQEGEGIWLTEAELQGLSKHAIESLTRGMGENEGKIHVPYSNSLPILKEVVNPMTRKRWFIGKHRTCSNNAPLFKEHAMLSHEKAVIEGYSNYASYTLSGNMISSPNEVRKLLQKARGRAIRVSDLESRKKAKLNDPHAEDKTFYFWDYAYYEDYSKWSIDPVDQSARSEEKTLERVCGFDSEFESYFPLQPTVRRMFSMFETVFGIVFEKIEGTFWHEGVELYAVWDEEAIGGDFCGYVYLDLCERPGKYPGNCNFPMQPRHVSSDGDTRYLSTIISCNFKPPTATKPCLLEHIELTSLFHEMGHCLHALFARVQFFLSGADWKRHDFNETPSILFEGWCYIPEYLKKLSGHYQTGKLIPDHLVKKIVDNKDKNIKVLDLRAISQFTFDLAVHTPASQKDADEMDIPALWNQIRSEVQGMMGQDHDEPDLRYLGVGYLVTGNAGALIMYVAGLFFSEIIWEKLFAKDPMSRKAGMRWRRGFLEKGCTEEPVNMLKELFGSWPTVDELCDDDNDSEASDSGSGTSDAALEGTDNDQVKGSDDLVEILASLEMGKS